MAAITPARKAGHVNYVQRVIDLINQELPGLDPELARFYALLVLVKGKNCTLEDVHDAWSLWCAMVDPEHRSIVPFGDLTVDVQDLDREYADGIHRVADRLETAA